jgi:hypothetical protein
MILAMEIRIPVRVEADYENSDTIRVDSVKIADGPWEGHEIPDYYSLDQEELEEAISDAIDAAEEMRQEKIGEERRDG